MKTKILTLMMILLTVGLVCRAGNDELNFKQTVISKIVYPEFAKDQLLEADVYVSFTVSLNGVIIINQSNSLNPDLMDYVKNELSKIKVNTDNEVIGKTFYFRFTFKLEE